MGAGASRLECRFSVTRVVVPDSGAVTGPVSSPSAAPPTDTASVPAGIRNLADAVAHRASTHGGSAALLVGDETVTWAALDARVDAFAAGLLGLDLAPGGGPAGRTAARVAIALANVVEFAVAFFGTLRAGLVAVPVNPGYTARELRHQLADSAASVLVAGAGGSATVAGIRAELPALCHLFVVGDAPGAGAAGDAPVAGAAGDAPVAGAAGDAPGAGAAGDAPVAGAAGRRFAEAEVPSGAVTSTAGGEDLALLLYTSGTAGAPKGAMLSHRALIANHRQLARVSPPIVTEGDVVLLALPMFHVFGLNSGLGAIAWHGACGVLVEHFDPTGTMRLIARHRVSVVTAVPQMFQAWSLLPDVGESMTTVRVAVSGAAKLDRATAQRFLDATGHPIFEGYGLTETAPVVATALASPVPKLGSIGRPIPDVEVRLVAADGSQVARVGSAGLLDGAPDDFDDDAGDGPGTDPGELVVRGENLFSGYWPDGSGGPDAGGWWPTGDVAYADTDGDLFLVDRLDELIIVSGFNVYPHEVELVLADHPGVAAAAVVGVEHPQTGESVKAFVVRASGSAVSAAELTAHCERNLARFKCPSVIEFVPALPYSATGKVRKRSLRSAS